MTLLPFCNSCKCDCPLDEDYLILDISGIAYYLHKDFLNSIPDGLIKHLWLSRYDDLTANLPAGVYKTQNSNRYFLTRSPDVFDAILQFYISGKLHTNSEVCLKIFQDEFEFWKINPSSQACKTCCLVKFPSAENVSGTDEDEIDDGHNDNTWRRFKSRAWRFFNNPTSSATAIAYAILTAFFIFISIVNLVVSSVPKFHLCPEKGAEIYTSAESDEIAEALETGLEEFNETLNTNRTNITAIGFKPDGVLRFFSNCLGMQKFEIVDMICILFFTLEFLARFTVCPNKSKFIKSPTNIIDFLASFPFYVEVLLWLFEFSDDKLSYTFTLIFRSLRSITVLRILKLGRYSKDLTVLAYTIKEAKNELLTLMLFITVETLIYGFIVFRLEMEEPNTKYTSIPASLWWSVTTVTTVGFGDIYPTTIAGKMVSGFACLTGIVLVAMPISTLVDKFNKVYRKNRSSDWKM